MVVIWHGHGRSPDGRVFQVKIMPYLGERKKQEGVCYAAVILLINAIKNLEYLENETNN